MTTTGEKRMKTVSGGKRAADKAAAEKLAELNALGDKSTVAWEKFAEMHLEELGDVSPAYVEEHRRVLERFKEHAPRHVADVRVDHVKAFTAALNREGFSKASVHGAHAVLRAILQGAVDRELLVRNPAKMKSTRPPKPPEPEIDPPTPDESKAILAACASLEWKTLAHVALSAGLRRAELYALEWSDVNLQTGRIRVVNKCHHETKSRKPRYTSTTPGGCELLAQMRALYPEAKLVFLETRGALTAEIIKHGIPKIAEVAKIERRITLHDLRRAAITAWIDSGMPLPEVQQRAGHASIQTTLKYYYAWRDKASVENAEIGCGFLDGTPFHCRSKEDASDDSRQNDRIRGGQGRS
ncbi:MAG TPA: tyrosine-type recombinase/integrase [Planctomycetota bacterium]|nr:tyrosine-type recombinase/integrase [Planctomycetota bacterium]